MKIAAILAPDIQQPWGVCRDRIQAAMQGVSGRSLPDYLAAPAMPAVPPMSRAAKSIEGDAHP
jgi:hypothetical protein